MFCVYNFVQSISPPLILSQTQLEQVKTLLDYYYVAKDYISQPGVSYDKDALDILHKKMDEKLGTSFSKAETLLNMKCMIQLPSNKMLWGSQTIGDLCTKYETCCEMMNGLSVVDNIWFQWPNDVSHKHPSIVFNDFINEKLNRNTIKKLRNHLGCPENFSGKYDVISTQTPSPASMLLQLLEIYADKVSPAKFIQELRAFVGKNENVWDNKLTRVHKQIKYFADAFLSDFNVEIGRGGKTIALTSSRIAPHRLSRWFVYDKDDEGFLGIPLLAKMCGFKEHINREDLFLKLSCFSEIDVLKKIATDPGLYDKAQRYLFNVLSTNSYGRFDGCTSLSLHLAVSKMLKKFPDSDVICFITEDDFSKNLPWGLKSCVAIAHVKNSEYEHWICLGYYNGGEKFFFYSSMYADGKDFLPFLRYTVKQAVFHNALVQHVQSRSQTDGTICGLFVLVVTHAILDGNIKQFNQYMLKDINDIQVKKDITDIFLKI